MLKFRILQPEDFITGVIFASLCFPVICNLGSVSLNQPNVSISKCIFAAIWYGLRLLSRVSSGGLTLILIELLLPWNHQDVCCCSNTNNPQYFTTRKRSAGKCFLYVTCVSRLLLSQLHNLTGGKQKITNSYLKLESGSIHLEWMSVSTGSEAHRPPHSPTSSEPNQSSIICSYRNLPTKLNIACIVTFTCWQQLWLSFFS